MHNLNLDVAGKHCVFQNNRHWFGVPCLSVRSIIPRPDLTLVPFTDPVLLGVSHIQNEFVPVFSLQSILSVEQQCDAELQNQLMLMGTSQNGWAMLIDRSVGLADLETSWSSMATIEDDDWSRLVAGSATWDSQILRILDPDAILRYAGKLMDGFWQDAAGLNEQPGITGVENTCEF